MAWQDDPVVEQTGPPAPAAASWQDDPVVEGPPAPAPAATVQASRVAQRPELNVFQRIQQAASDTSRPGGNIGDAFVEPAFTMGSGMAASAAGGLGFLGAAGLNATGLTDIQLPGLVERIQRALTYQPRTRAGEIGNTVVSYPFEKLAQLGNFLGKKTTEGVVSAGGNVPTAAAAGTTVGTTVQLAPALVLGALGRKTPAQQQAAQAQAEAAAKTFVDTRTPLSFDSLAQGTRETLTTIAQDPKALRGIERPTEFIGPDGLPRQQPAASAGGLDAAALERQARFESLPVPIETTSARITRDPVALRNEANASATTAGKPIRDVFVDNNAKLIENIQTLQGRRPSRGDVETGRAVQDAARAKLKAKKAEVDKLYTEARAAGELQGKVSPQPVLDVLKNAADKTDLKWVEGWLRDNKVVKKTATGTAVENLSLETLEGLRESANARVKNGGSDGYHAKKIVRAIDQATQGAGGVKYKAARKGRYEQALEFEDQAAVARLVDNNSRTDRAVALEDTWNDVVLRGSIDDLVKVKRSLLTGTDKASRTAGKEAWRDLRAETISYIEQQATKGVQLLEDGKPNVSPAALKRAVDKIGTDKLDQIFGSGTRKKIDEIVTAARDLKTEPTAIHGGSSTMGNVLAFLEKSISRIPGSSMLTGTVRAIGQVNELGKAGRQIRESQRDPLREVAQRVESRNNLRKLLPATAVQGDQ